MLLSTSQTGEKIVGNLFNELKRRNVVRVGIAYMVLGWVALQVGDILFEMFETPAWVGKTFAVVLLLGFPFVCLFAWAFEMTPEGVKKTAEVDRSESVTHSTGKKLNFVIMAALVVAVGYFIWERQQTPEPIVEASLDKSIAVLPFVNMSSDEEQEWFADGLTEEILNSLARTPDLLVAPRRFSTRGKTRIFRQLRQHSGLHTSWKALSGVAGNAFASRHSLFEPVMVFICGRRHLIASRKTLSRFRRTLLSKLRTH